MEDLNQSPEAAAVEPVPPELVVPPEDQADPSAPELSEEQKQAQAVMQIKMKMVQQFDAMYDAFRQGLERFPGHEFIRLYALIHFEESAKAFRDAIFNAPLQVQPVNVAPPSADSPIDPDGQPVAAEGEGAAQGVHEDAAVHD